MRVGFIGLGTIGAPMAQTLRSAGFPVTAFDPRAEPVARLVAAGGTAGRSPADVARGSDIIGICVLDDEQTSSVLWGRDGIAGAARPGTIVVIHSTIRPTSVTEMGEGLAEVGIRLLDAQVSGGDLRAADGTLAVMVGGAAADFADALPYLEAIGNSVRHMGPLGAGAATKLALQEMAFVNQLAAMEAAEFATRHGIEEVDFMAMAEGTTGESFATKNWGYLDRQLFIHILAGTESLYRFYDKDLLSLCVAARQHALSMPIAALSQQLLGPAFKARRAALEARGVDYARENG